MRLFLIRAGLAIFALVVIGYPLSGWYARSEFSFDAQLLITLYPAFGLFAATVMYLHIIGRPFKGALRGVMSFERFERISSFLVLVSIVLHPLLRNIYFITHDLSLVPPPDFMLPIGLGALGFLMLITYDLGKFFTESAWVKRWWWLIDIVSTLGFYVIWLHALLLGHDLQAGTARIVWIGYGVSAALASLYTLYQSRASTKQRTALE